MSHHIIVLGMHRSYTTLLATWLHQNGVPMFDPPLSTPRYYEDPEILALHEEFLASQDMNWLNARSPFTDPQYTFRNRCHALLKRRDHQVTLWGWKDPRTCILYEFLWEPVIQNAKFLVIYRDPAEVVESLLLRKIQMRTRYRYVPEVVYGWHLKRHRSIYDLAHLVCWNYYNRCLIQLLQSKQADDYIVLNAHALVQQEEDLYRTFTESWNISLAGPRLSTLIYPATRREKQLLHVPDKDVCEETAQLLETLHSLQSFK